MDLTFHQSALEDYQQWALADPKIFAKINVLLREIIRTPFSGSGQPEALKYELSGFWSRRITAEHRLVYKVMPAQIIIASCKYHYRTKR
ncbi:MAG: Txe/YoeB family addiction module toxin [Planctomycetota bacterium]|nr:Txe/YoeB family addiction module toxin [Planctomycetota bacterium]